MRMTKRDVALSSSRWDILWYLLAGYAFYVALILAFSMPGTISAQTGLILQPVLLLICLFGATWLFGERRGRFTWASLGLVPFRWRHEWLAWILATGATLAVFSLSVNVLITWFRDGNLARLFQIAAPIDAGGWKNLVLIWLGTALLTPLAEEIFFRGAVYTWFEQHYGSWPAVAGSATMFAITRFTFFDTASPFAALQSLAVGLVVAWLMRRTHALWVPIFVHILVRSLSLFIPMLLASLL